MAVQHLDDLDHALTQHGWRILGESRGSDTWGVSGTWQIARGGQRLLLEFEGKDADGVITYPMERAYACYVRDQPATSLYFGKRSTRSWREDLAAFVERLDEIART